MCFYFEGYKGNTGTAASKLTGNALQELVGQAAGIGALFVSIIAVLFMAHEYRYNTIMYTLTINARRTKVLLGKLITITIFGVLFGLAVVLFGIASYYLGLQFRDATLPAQNFDALTQFGRVAAYYAGYALVGMLLATLLRAVVGAIAVLLLLPTTIEPLLGNLLLKDNAAYLPFAALDNIMEASVIKGNISTGTALLVSAAYVTVGWLITWYLFLRRDAN